MISEDRQAAAKARMDRRYAEAKKRGTLVSEFLQKCRDEGCTVRDVEDIANAIISTVKNETRLDSGYSSDE